MSIEKYLSKQVEINNSIINNIISERVAKELPVKFSEEEIRATFK